MQSAPEIHCVSKHNFSLLLSFPLFYLATVEFRSSVDSGVCAQEHSVKSSLVLATKKSVTYPGDHQETSAKPPLYHKQPPALPPKPFPRIPNHSTGSWFPLVQTGLFMPCSFRPPQIDTVIVEHLSMMKEQVHPVLEWIKISISILK